METLNVLFLTMVKMWMFWLLLGSIIVLHVAEKEAKKKKKRQELIAKNRKEYYTPDPNFFKENVL